MRVLIVDDEAEIIMFLSAMIAEKHTVTATCNPADALLLIESDHFDVLITDYNMPTVSGLMLCERMREKNRHCYNILITGYEDYEYLVKDTVDHTLKKPFSGSKLLRLIDARPEVC